MTDKALTWTFVLGWTCATSVAGFMNIFGMLPGNTVWWYIPSLVVLPPMIGYIAYTEIHRGENDD